MNNEHLHPIFQDIFNKIIPATNQKTNKQVMLDYIRETGMYMIIMFNSSGGSRVVLEGFKSFKKYRYAK